MTSSSEDSYAQVEIAFSDELLAEIDQHAARCEVSRSAVVSEALEE